MPQVHDTLRPLFETTPEYVTDTVTPVTAPPFQPAPPGRGRKRGKDEYDMSTTAPMTQTGTSPGAGGNLAHPATNDNRFEMLLEASRKFGMDQGQGEDVQIKHLLSVTQAAFEGVIDNTVDKHSAGVDDATRITEEYWKARNKNVIFNPKAGNQRKTISTVRQVITLGGWSKGGPGEPIGMVNRAMTQYKVLRKNPDTAKRLMDAANYLVTLARRMKKSDQVLDDDELRELAFKPNQEHDTVADVLSRMRGVLSRMRGVAKKLFDGKHPAGVCNTRNIDAVIKALNKELKEIADASRSVANAAAQAEAGADIAAAADQQEKAGVAAPGAAA